MKKNVWLIVVLLLVFLGFVTAGTPAKASVDTDARFNNSPLLFLGNMNLAPIIFLDGGNPKGIDVDLVRALAPHISRPIEIQALNWSQAQALVARGEADALIQINPTEERRKIYDFSDTLLESQFSIFTRSDTFGISDISSLHGLKVGVESKGLPIQIIEKEPEIQVSIIPNFTEGFERLRKGSLDAVVVDYRVGSYVLAEHHIKSIKVSGDPIAFSNASLAVKKGNTHLLNEINHALQVIKSDGTYQKVLDSWKPTEGFFQTQEQITEGTYRYIIFILFSVFVIACAWILTIRRELFRRKSAEANLSEQYSIFRGIINSANAIIFSVDLQYRYTSFNQKHADVMNHLYGAEIKIGQNILDYISIPADRETLKRNLDQAFLGIEVVTDGHSGDDPLSRRYYYVSHTPIRSGDIIIGDAVLAHDITEQKKAEENLEQVLNSLEHQVQERTTQLSDANKSLLTEIAERKRGELKLSESENRYRAIYDKSPIAIELYDASGTLVDVNTACLELFGVERDHIIQIFSLFTDPNLKDEYKERLHQGETIHYQTQFSFEKVKNKNLYPTSKEGTIWLDVFITPLVQDAESIRGFLVQILDITKRKHAEDALRVAEETYRNIFLNARIGLFRTDIISGLMLDANDAVAQFFGYPDRSSLLAHPFNIVERYADSLDREKMVSFLQANGEFQNFETRIRKSDETIAWLRFSARLIWEKGWIEGVAEDITEYKLAVEALKESQNTLELALYGSETGMWEFHIPTSYITIDARGAELLGYDGETMSPHISNWLELAHPEDIPLLEKKLSNCINERTPNLETEHRIKHASGAWVWILGRGKITRRLSDGTPLLISGTMQDISERKRVEEGLIESEKRYRDMFEINNAVMLIIDSETTRIIDANAAALRYYGYSRDEITGMYISQINIADPTVIKKEITHAVGHEGMTFTFKHRKKSGEIRDVEVFSGPIVVKGKVYLHSIIQDITERKYAEEALKLTNHKLTLLSSITRHDIGNELQIIFGYLGLVMEKDLSAKVHEYIEKAHLSSLNIERQIAFTRDYEDIGVHCPVWQDVSAVIRRTVQNIDMQQIQEKIDIFGVEVFADPLMEKVFFNLVDNAKRYGETLTCIRFSGFPNSGSYIIICEDDGVGIPSEFKEKIFNREYYKHTGFGLNLSREILEITGITISETGVPGKGARFEILVPKGRFRITEE